MKRNFLKKMSVIMICITLFTSVNVCQATIWESMDKPIVEEVSRLDVFLISAIVLTAGISQIQDNLSEKKLIGCALIGIGYVGMLKVVVARW